MAARRIDLRAPGAAAELAGALEAARLACFPTDTVYGVGGRCSDGVAAAIAAAKGRPPDKPLQVVFASVASLLGAGAVPAALGDVVRRLLPGPLTLVVPCAAPGDWPSAALGAGAGPGAPPTLGLRVPRWPPPTAAFSAVGFPLLASSANPSGGSPARSVAAVDAALLAACDLVVDGGEVAGTASTVVDLTRFAATGEWRILRQGSADAQDIGALLSRPREDPCEP